MHRHPSHQRHGGIGLLTVVTIVFLVLLLGLGGCSLSGYNHAVDLDEAVEAQWGQVENQLQRRYDLIPNLVATIQGLTAHELAVFTTLAEARQGYFQAGSTDEKAAAAGRVEANLAKVMSLSETYPQLRSSEAFLKLQDQLEGSENRIAVERGRYNQLVERANAYRRRFPGAIFAGWAGLEDRSYFELSEAAREAGTSKVDFGD